MSLQERTLVVKNFDPEKTTSKLLKELCMQTGPVRNVVVKPDHAFVEYEDVESVGYSKALLDGVQLFGRTLSLEPKIRTRDCFKYQDQLNMYIQYDKQQRLQQEQLIAYQIQQAQLQATLLQQQQQQVPTTLQPPPPGPPAPIQPPVFQQPAAPPAVYVPDAQSIAQNLFNFTPITRPTAVDTRFQQPVHYQQQPGWNNYNANNIRRSRSFNQFDHNNQSNRNNWSDRRNSNNNNRSRR